MAATEYPTEKAVIAAMKAEIVELIKDGTIPPKVRSFEELHDYIDANMLAYDLFPPVDFYDDKAVEEHFEKALWVINPAQNRVNEWLAAGRPQRLTITATVDAADFAAFLTDHRDMEDVADSFDARLDEVFSRGPEVLTTVRVQSVTVQEEGKETK